jgi:DNA polymerase epsilon subunit 1
MIRRAVSNETFPSKIKKIPPRSFEELDLDEQAAIVKKRLQDYSKKIYHKIHDAKTIEREAIICQRENPFYVDTVRNFRDRRYDFKGQQKLWRGKTEALKSSGASAAEIEEAKKMIVLFDSLQLAHKVILNSFYGYVMRKGSRWYSMEMAGVTCLTGAHIIQMARELVERIGRPLELDTDGIWCMLPATFPENVIFTLENGKKMAVSYPCIMLNHLVHQRFTNHQYQTLTDRARFKYETHSDNSIFFEVDGPYKAMILPTSKEEDKNLKKRYAVFNQDGSLAELKGFEVKRRGELKLIKIFQTQIFKFFLEGTNLTETYGAVARVADRWLDVLHSHGVTLADEELIDLICENKSMAKTLEEYGAQKSTSITTARRLADFLGEQMIKDKGLNCKYIISSRPKNTPVTERALPVAIFSAEDSVKRYFLRKWLKDDPGDMDPRSVIDWQYYLERLGSVIQKLITIPAALQKVRNPVPRVAHPEWLQRRINTKDDKFKQKKMTDMFEKRPLGDLPLNILEHRLPGSGDIEDVLSLQLKSKVPEPGKMLQKRKSPDGPRAPVDPFTALPPKMPSIQHDYPSWLQYQKQKWRIQKQARLRRRQLFGERPTAASDALSSFFRNQAELLFVSTWQVLQLRETASPGEIRAFVLIGKKIHPLTIRVPRQFFLNLKGQKLPDVEIAGCDVEKVNHTLPNGRPSVHLFKLTLSEVSYTQESENLSLLCNHPSVEGVYERRVPLSIRALLKLGSLCSFDESQKGVLGKGLEHGFDLSALLRSPSKEAYLSNPSEMGYLFLYHVLAGERQVFALFSSERKEAQIMILNRKREAQGLPNIDKVYEEQLLRKAQESDDGGWQAIFRYQDKIHFKISQTITKRKLHLEVGDLLKKWRGEETKPMLMVIQSAQQRQLVHDVGILREYPVLALRSESSDSDLPPLGWQASAARRSVSHYLTLNAWLSHLVELARYGDVPLCNLACDDPRFLVDIAYARRLQRSNVVLWWSERPCPDHAGHEKDDVRGPLIDKVEIPTVNNAGAYSSVCIDLEVRNLAINTILTSSLINELEGSNDSISFNPAADDGNTDEHGTLASANAFANAPLLVLREMVKAWWAEACRGNPLADVMVQHLVRWVESPSSFLYDRCLHYYVQTMSKKAFQQLMTDFRRVGSHTIFASSNRLLLQTGKQDVGNAYAYSQYIIKSIQQKPLFHFLDLEVKDYWDVLVWYDAYNYGGKGSSTIDQYTDSTNLETIMHWQLSRFLPFPLQADFDHWIVEYIDLIHRLKRPHVVSVEDASSTTRPTQLPATFTSITEDPTSTEVTIILREPFSKPLKKEITSLIRRQRDELLHPELASDWSFPSLPGGTLDTPNRNPVLELVKALMQVLSLSKPLQLETRLLRKELLALFDVREFSAEARYENPSKSLKLEQVSCESCTMTRDLDLCRDEDLLPSPAEPDGEAAESKAWKCKACGADFSRLVLEEELIARVQRWVLEGQMQDVRCVKCGVLQSDTTVFMEHCTCGGSWEGTVDRKVLRERIEITERVADAHQLRMLEAFLESIRGIM